MPESDFIVNQHFTFWGGVGIVRFWNNKRAVNGELIIVMSYYPNFYFDFLHFIVSEMAEGGFQVIVYHF